MNSKLFTSPFFSLGLFIRLLLVFSVYPKPVTEWFAPFLKESISTFSFDPWAVWLSGGGTSVAFPYGYVMWLAFMPLTLLFKLKSGSQTAN